MTTQEHLQAMYRRDGLLTKAVHTNDLDWWTYSYGVLYRSLGRTPSQREITAHFTNEEGAQVTEGPYTYNVLFPKDQIGWWNR